MRACVLKWIATSIPTLLLWLAGCGAGSGDSLSEAYVETPILCSHSVAGNACYCCAAAMTTTTKQGLGGARCGFRGCCDSHGSDHLLGLHRDFVRADRWKRAGNGDAGDRGNVGAVQLPRRRGLVHVHQHRRRSVRLFVFFFFSLFSHLSINFAWSSGRLLPQATWLMRKFA